MSNIKKQNDLRINLSSFSSIRKLNKYVGNNKINYSINNSKIININNFKIKIKDKLIKYSTFYTNPYCLKSNIIKNIKFDITSNKIIKNLCKKIFLSKDDYKINKQDDITLNYIIRNKNKYLTNGYIGLELCSLILWYIVFNDKFINITDKQIYRYLIKYFYIKFELGEFNIGEIIYHIMNEKKNIVLKKFCVSTYILCDEFHFKYIAEYLKKTSNFNIIFSSNYVKINPQDILNDLSGRCNYSTCLINEDLSNPFGHNMLLIKTSHNKVYYYDPDEQDISDIYKLKILFDSININFLNISNRKPIQTISDDSKCVFYCLGLIKWINLKNIKSNNVNNYFELNKLKKIVLEYETFLISFNIDIYKWLIL